MEFLSIFFGLKNTQTAPGTRDLSTCRISQTYGLIICQNRFKSSSNTQDYVLFFIKLGMIVYIKQMVQVFSIPPDNDDSSVNLALLGLMK